MEAYIDEVARHHLLNRHALYIGKPAKVLNGYLGCANSRAQTRDD